MIILYRGPRGRGKTLTMCKDAYNYYLRGFRILSNFSLTFGEKITAEELLSLDIKSILFNCVLVIDEIELFFDSRDWNRKEIKFFSQFLQQLRKRNIIILCTAQYIDMIEKRIRQQLDVVCYPHFYKNTLIVKCRYFDLTQLEDLNKLESGKEANLKPVVVVFDARSIFPLYDTYEILN
jgi:hypothetical protein